MSFAADMRKAIDCENSCQVNAANRKWHISFIAIIKEVSEMIVYANNSNHVIYSLELSIETTSSARHVTVFTDVTISEVIYKSMCRERI